MYKFLVIDDDPEILTIFTEIFEDTCDCTVHTTVEIESAIDYINNNKYDLISLDYSMPNMSGAELAHVIRREGQNQNTPIVFVTGFLLECHESSKDIENVAYLDKKKIYTEMVPLIMNVLDRQAAENLT